MTMQTSICVSILAAGRSSRLGQPKQLVQFQGEPLLRRQCRTALAAEVGPVSVVLGSSAQECAAVLADQPVDVVVNPNWEEGLGSSIACAALHAVKAQARGLLLILGDQYRLTPADLQLLHRRWLETEPAACVAEYGDDFGPPVLFSSSCFVGLLELTGEQGARRFLNSLPSHEWKRYSMPNAQADLDSPSDLAILGVS